MRVRAPARRAPWSSRIAALSLEAVGEDARAVERRRGAGRPPPAAGRRTRAAPAGSDRLRPARDPPGTSAIDERDRARRNEQTDAPTASVAAPRGERRAAARDQPRAAPRRRAAGQGAPPRRVQAWRPPGDSDSTHRYRDPGAAMAPRERPAEPLPLAPGQQPVDREPGGERHADVRQQQPLWPPGAERQPHPRARSPAPSKHQTAAVAAEANSPIAANARHQRPDVERQQTAGAPPPEETRAPEGLARPQAGAEQARQQRLQQRRWMKRVSAGRAARREESREAPSRAASEATSTSGSPATPMPRASASASRSSAARPGAADEAEGGSGHERLDHERRRRVESDSATGRARPPRSTRPPSSAARLRSARPRRARARAPGAARSG